MSREKILAAIPHRDPFLLLDEIVEQEDDRIVCRKTFTGDEFWFAGHYPDFPIVPGVILCEAAMQAGAVLLAARLGEQPGKAPVATGADRVQFKRMVRPGDTVLLETRITEEVSGKYYLTGRVSRDEKLVARLDFACALIEKERTHGAD